MRQYWLRVFGAWVLLGLAGRIMKGAEAVLQAAAQAREITPEDTVDPTLNGTVPDADLVSEYVEARYDG